ncbi:hypothetical protein [Akkermansia muciniphila]|uniref:hypothetical protein n=1 Tax=Akkermansia muciniphila TaxID=239935 RepID=UPI001C06221E|nr:hypothetical protein [Akkermansia muciniphila]QWP04833.1 hypothetical protein J5W77_09275 [Akkermansia muciniphila]QWP25004.1 hypothetical protein J5W81_03600 [Akkermansia muciniphila]QWP28628.1 hypothetical protein J5W80_09315 [Akkermansia muciniphila]
MIAPLTTPDGKAVIPVDDVIRSVLCAYKGWNKDDFNSNEWDEESSELEWMHVLREHVRSVQANAFKKQYALMLDKLNISPCWRIWIKDNTPVWMTNIFEHEPPRREMTQEELRLAALADAGKLHPCVPWLSRWPVWFPVPKDEEIIQWGKKNGLYIPAIHPKSGKKVICVLPGKLLKAYKMTVHHFVFM